MELGRFRFEKLLVWQRAVDLSDVVYNATRSFPKEERYGLTAQMRNSVVSISSNVAEGCARRSLKDRRRFVEIAYGSLMELVSQSFVAHRQSMLSPDTFQQVYVRSDEIARMLSSFRTSLGDEENE